MSRLQSDVFVFFGATGDLAFKEIFPALFALHQHGQLNIPVIGVARSALSDSAFHQRARDSLAKHGSFKADDFNDFSRRLSYLAGNINDANTFQNLTHRLRGYSRPLFYLALPPDMFEAVALGLSRMSGSRPSRLIVEKPFGRNLVSAQALSKTLRSYFPESSIFRLDHFLAMETVINLVYFRLSNMFVQPWWTSNYIEQVQITLAESFGIEGRGAFYDEVGAVRDVVQNHLLQILGLLTMECTGDSFHSLEDLHAEQLNVFRRIKPVTLNETRFGQFNGYRHEEGVSADSGTETYVAMRLEIDNDRWRGVPFYIRTGKCLPITCTEVVITLKTSGLPWRGTGTPLPNTLRFRLYPDMEIGLEVQVSAAGRLVPGRPAELITRGQIYPGVSPYERLLGDAINGDNTLFTRRANTEEAWRIVDGILDRDAPVAIYAAGSWGPPESDQIMLPGHRWRTPTI